MRRLLRVSAVILSALLVLGALVQVAAAKKKGPRCSARLCREGIVACTSVGEKRRACKKGIVRACRLVGPALCLPPTTTTTIPPVPTTLDVNGTWGLVAAQTQNPCGIEISPTLDGPVAIEQSGSVLVGRFGENALAGRFTAADAFVFAVPNFCSAPGCCGSAALSASGIGGTPGRLVGNAVFEFTARCLGLTCNLRFEGVLTQGSAGGGGGGGGGGGPKR